MNTVTRPESYSSKAKGLMQIFGYGLYIHSPMVWLYFRLFVYMLPVQVLLSLLYNVVFILFLYSSRFTYTFMVIVFYLCINHLENLRSRILLENFPTILHHRQIFKPKNNLMYMHQVFFFVNYYRGWRILFPTLFGRGLKHFYKIYTHR